MTKVTAVFGKFTNGYTTEDNEKGISKLLLRSLSCFFKNLFCTIGLRSEVYSFLDLLDDTTICSVVNSVFRIG